MSEESNKGTEGKTQEKIYVKGHEATWFISARSFSQTADAQTLGKTLSGLHGKFVAFLIDESGAIPIPIMKAAEQAVGETLGRGGFALIVQAGNPLTITGMLYKCFNSDLWYKITITADPDDPKRSRRISIEWAKQMIDELGRDDPWVQAYILGIFPDGGINTLFGLSDVEDSMEGGKLRASDLAHSERILGVDVARFGMDSSVISPRRGLMAYNQVVLRGLNGHQLGQRVITAMRKFSSHRVFVDDTGGHGSSVVDYMMSEGESITPINFASKSDEPEKFFNKRSEMFYRMSVWVKRGGQLPKCDILKKELLGHTYCHKKGKLAIVEKEMIVKDLGFSPDRADALALTFANIDRSRPTPIEELAEALDRGYHHKPVEYNPLYDDPAKLYDS